MTIALNGFEWKHDLSWSFNTILIFIWTIGPAFLTEEPNKAEVFYCLICFFFFNGINVPMNEYVYNI